jgi:hypothetical protein
VNSLKTTRRNYGKTLATPPPPFAQVDKTNRLHPDRCFDTVAGTGFTQQKTRTIPLDDLNEMQSRNVKKKRVTYKGRGALRVTDATPANTADGLPLVI